MSKPKSIEVYDLVLKKNFILNLKNSFQFGITEGPFYILKGKRQIQIYDRFILPENRDKLFTIVNAKTLEEFECITPTTFLLLNPHITNQDTASKSISNLKLNKVYETTIQGQTFRLKGGKPTKTMERESIVLYDIFEDKDIVLKRGEIVTCCKEIGIDHTQLYDLGKGREKTIKNRYIIPEYKNELFTLVDTGDAREYQCINNKSLFLQLGVPCNENETKYIYALKADRQKTATIAGRVFKLKEKTLNGTSKIGQDLELRMKEKERKRIRHKTAAALRNRISIALKRRNAKKTNKTLDLTGCSIDFLVAHIEKQFESGMSWENYGLWEIDHIKPVASFPLDTEESQRECCHYSNLRPLWTEENRSKNDKSPEEWEKYKAEKLKRQEVIRKSSSFSYSLAS